MPLLCLEDGGTRGVEMLSLGCQWLYWSMLPCVLRVQSEPAGLRSLASPKIPTSETSQSIWPAILILGQLLLWFWLAVIKNLGCFYLRTCRIGSNLFMSDGVSRWNLFENGGLLPNQNKGRRNCTDLPPGKKSQKLKSISRGEY